MDSLYYKSTDAYFIWFYWFSFCTCPNQPSSPLCPWQCCCLLSGVTTTVVEKNVGFCPVCGLNALVHLSRALIIIYCTFYKIIYCLWFGRPGRPQPTAWACDTGGRELYYADFDIAPFSRADHYIWYIIIQYTYILSCRFDISHLFCVPFIMQETKALTVHRYH